MRALILAAWTAGRAQQRREIEHLKRQQSALRSADLSTAFRAAREWSEWSTDVEENVRSWLFDIMKFILRAPDKDYKAAPNEIRLQARDVTKLTFKVYSQFMQYDGFRSETSGDVSTASAARARLRLLERHEAADCVEYRLFASALADSDNLVSAAGAPAVGATAAEVVLDSFVSKSRLFETEEALEADAEMNEAIEAALGSVLQKLE